MHTFDGSQHTEKAEEHLREVYDQFDMDGEGINADEIHNIMLKVDPDVTQEEANQIFKETDSDGSGRINFDEFHDAVLGATGDQTEHASGQSHSKSHMHLLVKVPAIRYESRHIVLSSRFTADLQQISVI